MWDFLVKKGGHMAEYAVLALALRHAWGEMKGRSVLAWGCALAYAVTDELHQAFVPGRHPSAVDALVFDNLGAVLALWARDRSGRARHGPA
jgi:VanZ family protein